MHSVEDLVAGIKREGFFLVKEALENSEVETLLAEFSSLVDYQVTRQGRSYATRNLLKELAVVQKLATSQKILALVNPLVGENAFPVRAILFDKIPEANWYVRWHQDTVIPVAKRIETLEEFSAWTTKSGIEHVKAPAKVLEKMITIRFHLDDVPHTNGALRVIPQSHRHGIYQPNEIEEKTSSEENITICDCKRGDALLMRPLILHSSSPAKIPTHRRVLHLEYAASKLPGGLVWEQA